MTRGAKKPHENRTKSGGTKSARVAPASETTATTVVRVGNPTRRKHPPASGWFLRYENGRVEWESSETVGAWGRHWALVKRNEKDYAARARDEHHCAKEFSIFLRGDAEGRAHPLEVTPLLRDLFDNHDSGPFKTFKSGKTKEPFRREECAKLRSPVSGQPQAWHVSLVGVIERLGELLVVDRSGVYRRDGGGQHVMLLREEHRWKIRLGLQMMDLAQQLLGGNNGGAHGISSSGGDAESAPLPPYMTAAAAAAPAAPSEQPRQLVSPPLQQWQLSSVPSELVMYSARDDRPSSLSLVDAMAQGSQLPLQRGDSTLSAGAPSRSGSHGLAFPSAPSLLSSSFDDEESCAPPRSPLPPVPDWSPLPDDGHEMDTVAQEPDDEQQQQHTHHTQQAQRYARFSEHIGD